MQLYHWQYHQHHMMPMPAQYAWHDQKSCCTSLWLSWPKKCNVSLIILLALHDIDAGTNGITWSKSSVSSHFVHLNLPNEMVPLMTLFSSCDTEASIIYNLWPRKICCMSLQSSWPCECIGAIDNAIGITWCWCQCQQCQMRLKKVMLHGISILLN